MIQSMTGYGKAVVAYGDKKINVEVKSLNSKTLDLTVRICPLYREKELELRQTISKVLERGKVDFSLWIEREVAAEALPINAELMKNYYTQIVNIVSTTGIPEPQDIFSTLLKLPDVMTKTDVEVLTDEEWSTASEAVNIALGQLVEFRRQEGAALQKKFEEKIDNIEALLASIEPFEKCRVEKIRQRIIDGLASIPEVEYDKNRLEQ